MHEAYVISPSARNSRYFLLKEIKKLVPPALLSSISTWGFLRTLEGCENHEPKASASRHFSRVLKNSRVLIELNNALGAFFISLITLFWKRFWRKINSTNSNFWDSAKFEEICYSPAGRSDAYGLGRYSRHRAKFFPIRTILGWCMTLLFFSLKINEIIS